MDLLERSFLTNLLGFLDWDTARSDERKVAEVGHTKPARSLIR